MYAPALMILRGLDAPLLAGSHMSIRSGIRLLATGVRLGFCIQ
jgi:hypothetical protein